MDASLRELVRDTVRVLVTKMEGRPVADFEEWYADRRDELEGASPDDLNFQVGRLCGLAEGLDVTVGQLLDESGVFGRKGRVAR